LAAITFFLLSDWPRDSAWLPPEERDWITGELQQEKAAKSAVRSFSVWQAVRYRPVVLMTLVNFL
jgi:ACS family tartrate transporter-like MFS transporter